MPIYITTGRYTHGAIAGMMAKPEDRGEAVKALLAAGGVKMRDYFVTFGDTDFMVISEGDVDAPTMASMLIAAAAGGGVSNLSTVEAMTSAQAKQAFEKAKALVGSFKPAGQS